MKQPKVRTEDIEAIISMGGIVYDIEEHGDGYRVRRTRSDMVNYLPLRSADFESYESKEEAANLATMFASNTETIPVMLILPDDLECEYDYPRVQFANIKPKKP